MPAIKAWCLPEMDEAAIKELYEAIVGAIISVKKLGLTDENDTTTLFPLDMMSYGLGNDIFIEVINLAYGPGWDPETRLEISSTVGSVVKNLLPKAERVTCLVRKLNPEYETVWHSPKG